MRIRTDGEYDCEPISSTKLPNASATKLLSFFDGQATVDSAPQS